MGFESFLVRLRAGPATVEQADAAVRAFPGAAPDPDGGLWREATYYTVADGRHVLEVMVSGPPVEISCRFTLCHPRTVDAALIGFASAMMLRLGMEVRVVGEVFTADDLPAFAAAVSAAVTPERAGWAAQCGPEEYPATTRQAFERFILPLCEPAR